MSLPTTSPNYEIFKDSRDRQNVYDACIRAADFAVDHEVGNMVFLDRAARPMWIGISECYKQHHPENDIPAMFFVNPNGFYRPIARLFNPGLIKRKLEKRNTSISTLKCVAKYMIVEVNNMTINNAALSFFLSFDMKFSFLDRFTIISDRIRNTSIRKVKVLETDSPY